MKRSMDDVPDTIASGLIYYNSLYGYADHIRIYPVDDLTRLFSTISDRDLYGRVLFSIELSHFGDPDIWAYCERRLCEKKGFVNFLIANQDLTDYETSKNFRDILLAQYGRVDIQKNEVRDFLLDLQSKIDVFLQEEAFFRKYTLNDLKKDNIRKYLEDLIVKSAEEM